MMHAILRSTGPEIVNGAFRDEQGISHPANVLTLWTAPALAAIGVYPVQDGPVPEGHVVTGSSLTWDGQTVTRVFTTEPAPPPPIPEIVSRFQARAALLYAGKLADAEAAVAASGDALTQLAWAEAVEWKRTSPALNALAAAIGMSSSEIDDLFRTAATIEA
jgi:hypothetical protein